MLKQLQVSASEVFEQLKMSCKLASVVQETVVQQIIRDAAQAAGITISDLELQQSADEFRVRYDLYNPATTWNWLQQNYLTGDEFERLIEESVITSKLIQHLFADRVEPYFYQHQLDYTQAALYEIIFTDFDTAIEQFYALEEKEVTFIEVARQYIQEPDLRRQYGYQGMRSRTALHSAISAAVFACYPPQLLKPIIIGKNVHLILVEEIVQPQLNESLQSQILEQLFADWLQQQLPQYSIEIQASTEPPKPIYQQFT